MEKVIVEIQEWEMLATLPTEVAGFVLQQNLEKRGTQYYIFTYENEKCHRSFSVLYDTATKEFLARTVIGLTEYFDVNYIVADIQLLEKLLKKRLHNTLLNLAEGKQEDLDSILVEKQILQWPYGRELPQEIAGFTLFIKPWEPIKIINGSYVIIDYSDFLNASSLVIYYNIFRDEFFGEIRIRRTPHMSAIFDATTLEKLQELISTHLTTVLGDVREKLT